jgi:branched-chain amino acid transport system permease protein
VSLGPVRLTTLQLLIVILAIGIVAATGWMLGHTEVGREVRSVAHDRATAALLGVRVDRVSAAVFFVSGAMAGVAACCVAAAFNVVSADLGPTYLVVALAAMVVGGFGSVTGILAGGWLIGLSATLATGYLDSSYRDLVVFGLLLAFLALRPQGLFRSRAELSRV